MKILPHSPGLHAWLRAPRFLGALALAAIASIPGSAFAGQAADASPAFHQSASVESIGSGDGRIQIIPALDRPSIKNGERLGITAVVRSRAMVGTVTADLGGLARVTLRPDSTVGGVSVDGTTGVWSGEWIGAGLEEKIYTASITVTDIAGHSFTDSSLEFSDPAAGNSTPGTTNYPNGAIRRLGAFVGEYDESNLRCALVDPVNGYAYLATTSIVPSIIIKVSLGTGDNPPVRIGQLALPDTDLSIQSGVIDTAAGYAYFGTSSIPPQVVKIALGAGDALPTRVGSAFLNGNEAPLLNAVIDPGHGYAYFGTGASPAQVVKVALGSGNTAPSRVGAVTLNTGEDWTNCSVIDTANGYAYFGTWTAPARVVKVALGNGNAAPTRVGAVTFNANENQVQMAMIDPADGYAYFGTASSQGRLVKVALGAGANPPTRVGVLTLPGGEGNLREGIIDSANNLAWIPAGFTIPGSIIKVDLGTGDNAPTRLSALPLADNEDSRAGSGGDLANGRGYFFSQSTPGAVTKVALGAGTAPSSRIGTLQLVPGDSSLQCAVVDNTTGYAYFATNTSPASIVKVALDGTGGPPIRIGSVTLASGESAVRCGVIDPANGYAYFGTNTNPGRVVKVALGAGNGLPTRVGALTLDQGEGALLTAVIDTQNSHAYFAATTFNPSKIVKVALGSGNAAPTRVAGTFLEDGELGASCSVIDVATGYAYFGLNLNPGRVVKVALGSGAAAPVRIGALTLNAGENALRCAGIDNANGYAYFGTATSPARLVKVDLASGANPPLRVGAVTLNSGEDSFLAGSIDAAGGYFYGATSTIPSIVTKIALGAGSSDPVRTGAVTLDANEGPMAAAVFDSKSGVLCLGTNPGIGARARVIQVGPGLMNQLLGTRFVLAETAGFVNDVRFFSHSAVGNLRLALYDNAEPRNLLWQSGVVANTGANADVVVPVSSGSPSSLILAAGTYWLAWQTDSTADVGSYTPGAAGDGFAFKQSFGTAPATLASAQATTTNQRWTAYITYSTDDGQEPNQNTAQADAKPSLFAGQSYTFQLRDDDWYRLALAPGHALRVVVDQFDAAADDVQIQLFDSRVGDSVGYPIMVGASYSATNTESTFYVDRTAISLDEQNAGFLYLRVYSEGGAFPGVQYRVRTFDLGRDDAFEPNNEPCIPLTIARNTTYSDLIAGDDDVFRVNTTGLSTIHVNVLQGSKYAGQLYWQVLGDNGNCGYDVLQGFYIPNLDTPMEADVNVSGRSSVLVRVYPGFIGGTNMYSLRVD